MTVSQSDSVLRLGVIGCGVIGPTHAGAIRQIDGVTLAAVADTIAERADAMARQFDVPRAYHTHTDLLADPEIDAVTVCTPSGSHAAIAVDALRAGKHVIVEKPMDVSLEACDRMIAAAADTG